MALYLGGRTLPSDVKHLIIGHVSQELQKPRSFQQAMSFNLLREFAS